MLQSIEVNYHEGDYGALILDGLAPIIADLNRTRSANGAFLYPYWRGGPHINLVIDAKRSDFTGHLYPRAAATIGEWIERNPSLTRIDPIEYRRLSRHMATTERDPRRPVALRANNSVRSSRYYRPAPIGLAKLGHIRDRFLAETIDTQLAVRRLSQDGLRQRLEAILPILLSVAAVRPGPDFAFWPLSFVAHGKVFLVNNPRHAEQFEQVYKRFRETAASGVAEATAEAALAGPASPWHAALRTMDARIAAIVAEDFDKLDRTIWAGAEEANVLNGNPLGMDPDNFVAFRNQAHLSWRMMQNFVYLTMPVMGVSAVERGCLCYVIGRVIEDCHPDLMKAAQTRMMAMLAHGKRRA
ncbi:hypothetical protein BH10PSE14_BH10PSE14_04060 [soil metagenome]